jgi:phage-related protein
LYNAPDFFILRNERMILMIGTKFYYDGVSSDSMGVSLIRTNSGMINVPYIPARDMIEDFPTMASAPYTCRSKAQQYQFTLAFSTLTNDMTTAKLKTIASWLFKDTYKPFYSEDEPEKIYYLFATNQVDFLTNGMNEGYFEVAFKSKYPYALTTASTPTYTISGSQSIVINNLSNVATYYYPQFEFTITGTSSFSIQNNSDGGRSTVQNVVSIGETVYIDNAKKQIISSTGQSKYLNFNKNWFRLVQGTNNLVVSSQCTLQFRLQFPIYS